jgi:2-polyprenyl-3-methyl-5-hydroxy-6-metoxy-1,4-benzoquinol methylase
MNLQHRNYTAELLDAPNIPFHAIEKNMEELNFINTYLGGHAITVNGCKQLVGVKKQITICEIGCGGGDNLVAIKKWCNKNAMDVFLVGIDIKKECIDVAKKKLLLYNNCEWIISDYNDVKFTKKPDIIFSSLFCHHFTNQQLIHQISWLQTNSTIGFFINDLQRHWLAYTSIKWLTQLFSKSYLVKNDAPLSVARSFVKGDWELIFAEANILKYSIQWKWAFRYLIVYKHDK